MSTRPRVLTQSSGGDGGVDGGGGDGARGGGGGDAGDGGDHGGGANGGGGSAGGGEQRNFLERPHWALLAFGLLGSSHRRSMPLGSVS